MTGIIIFDMLQMLAKGVLIGILASAPMGPVGVLTVQRTLVKGRWYGFATGVGAACSDFAYALLTGIFMGFAMSFAESPWAVRWLKPLGSVVLLLFGIYFYIWKPAPLAVRPSGKVGTLAHNMLTGFLVTCSNPLIVVFFLVLFARFGFVPDGHPVNMAVGYVGLLAGALLWWYLLTAVLYRVRGRFAMEQVRLLNRCLGVLVMLVALGGLAYSLVLAGK
ncbi:MAG TPA: lysine transporter LysE [Prevotellaceae bacterium]|nr:lysine transporter LysE [Prevotellaceae bacterium]